MGGKLAFGTVFGLTLGFEIGFALTRALYAVVLGFGLTTGRRGFAGNGFDLAAGLRGWIFACFLAGFANCFLIGFFVPAALALKAGCQPFTGFCFALICASGLPLTARFLLIGGFALGFGCFAAAFAVVCCRAFGLATGFDFDFGFCLLLAFCAAFFLAGIAVDEEEISRVAGLADSGCGTESATLKKRANARMKLK